MKIADVKFVFVEPDLLQNMLLAGKEVGLSPSKVFLFDSEPLTIESKYPSWHSLLDHGEEDWIAFDDEHKSKNSIAALLSTSGTTGLPKAAELSHYSFVSQSIMLYDSKDKPYEVRWNSMRARYNLTHTGQETTLPSTISCLLRTSGSSGTISRGPYDLCHAKIPSGNVCSVLGPVSDYRDSNRQPNLDEPFEVANWQTKASVIAETCLDCRSSTSSNNTELVG